MKLWISTKNKERKDQNLDSYNIWQEEVGETYINNARNINFPRIVKCPKCQIWSYRYIDSRSCRVCSS